MRDHLARSTHDRGGGQEDAEYRPPLYTCIPCQLNPRLSISHVYRTSHAPAMQMHLDARFHDTGACLKEEDKSVEEDNAEEEDMVVKKKKKHL